MNTATEHCSTDDASNPTGFRRARRDLERILRDERFDYGTRLLRLQGGRVEELGRAARAGRAARLAPDSAPSVRRSSPSPPTLAVVAGVVAVTNICIPSAIFVSLFGRERSTASQLISPKVPRRQRQHPRGR